MTDPQSLADVMQRVVARGACVVLVMAAVGCGAPPVPEAAQTLAALPDCATFTGTVTPWPTVTRVPVGELEHYERQVDYCLVHASPALSYPCTNRESVVEAALAEVDQRVLIQRDERNSSGCWTGRTVDRRLLRVADRAANTLETLHPRVVGDVIAAPDGGYFVFAARPEPDSLVIHLMRVNADGRHLTRLDTEPLPQPQVVGAQLLGWSDDGDWLRVTLWDGGEQETSWRPYELRTDGSGEYR